MAKADYDKEYKRIIAAEGDPYRILDVDSRADDNEIKAQYRRLALLFHPDKTNRMAERQSQAVASDLKARSNDAFRLIGLACALLLDPEKREEYDRRSRKGGTVGPAGKDSLGGVHVDNDPERFYNTLFQTSGKAQGTDAFQNWMDLAQHGHGESALGAVIHGNPALAQSDADTDDHVAKKLASLGLADHTSSLSIPGAEDAPRNFKSNRSRTTHTNRRGETTIQRMGQSTATIDGGHKGSITVHTTYKVIGFQPKVGGTADKTASGPLPGGLSHTPASDPRFRDFEAEHDREMEDERHHRSDRRTWSDPDLQDKYDAGLITAPDGRSISSRKTGRTELTSRRPRPGDDDATTLRSRAASRNTATSRPYEGSLAPSRLENRARGYDVDERSLAASSRLLDDSDTMYTARTRDPSMAPSHRSSGGHRDDNRSMRTTRMNSLMDGKTSRGSVPPLPDDFEDVIRAKTAGDDQSLAGTMIQETRSIASRKTSKTSKSASNMRDYRSRYGDMPPVPEFDATTLRTKGSRAPTANMYGPAGYSDDDDRDTMRTANRALRDTYSMKSSRSGKTTSRSVAATRR